jgi:TonB family protein
MKLNTWNCFLASIGIHLLCIFYFYKVKQNEVSNFIPLLPTYVAYHQETGNSKKIVSKNKNSLIKAFNEKKAGQQQSLTFSSEKNDKSITHRILLKMLHDHIAEQEVYPASALELNQSGAVTIHFVLEPNGLIHDIILTKSSGFAAIDSAALNAVESISPLKNVSDYLKSQEVFSIDILYQ